MFIDSIPIFYKKYFLAAFIFSHSFFPQILADEDPEDDVFSAPQIDKVDKIDMPTLSGKGKEREFHSDRTNLRRSATRSPSIRASRKSHKLSGQNTGKRPLGGKNRPPSELESLLEEKMREKTVRLSLEKEKQKELEEKWLTYRMPRKVAAPVEKILREIESPSPDFYSILGVGLSADLVDIRRSYRDLSLLVHPDKNPHPRSELAFDGLQSAYEVLSDANSRREYDEEVRKLRRVRRLTARKLRRQCSEFYQNTLSRWLQLRQQLAEGAVPEEVESLRAAMGDGLMALLHLLAHFALLPSATDRWLMGRELLWRHRRGVALLAATWSLLR